MQELYNIFSMMIKKFGVTKVPRVTKVKRNQN